MRYKIGDMVKCKKAEELKGDYNGLGERTYRQILEGVILTIIATADVAYMVRIPHYGNIFVKDFMVEKYDPVIEKGYPEV